MFTAHYETKIEDAFYSAYGNFLCKVGSLGPNSYLGVFILFARDRIIGSGISFDSYTGMHMSASGNVDCIDIFA